MLVNKSGRMLVIGRLKIRNGESVPGIVLTSGEQKGIESFKKAGYLVEEGMKAALKPEVKPVPAAAPEPVATPEAESEPRRRRRREQQPQTQPAEQQSVE